jgi:hypothetical protein
MHAQVLCFARLGGMPGPRLAVVAAAEAARRSLAAACFGIWLNFYPRLMSLTQESAPAAAAAFRVEVRRSPIPCNIPTRKV